MTKYVSLAAIVAFFAVTACDSNPTTDTDAINADSLALISPTEQNLMDVASEPLMDEEMTIEDEAHGLRAGSTFGDIRKAYPNAVARRSADGLDVEVVAGEYIFYLDYGMDEPAVDLKNVPLTARVLDVTMTQDAEHGVSND